ncbi:MAG TPA: hypothetical protein VIH35_09310, partial [Kiritimatiellia bacterium]
MPQGFLIHLGLTLGLVGVAAATVYSPVLALAAVTGFAGVLAASRRLAFYGLLLLVALVPLDSLGQVGAGAASTLSVTKLIFPVLFGAMLWDRIASRRDFLFARQTLYIFCLALAIALSFLINGVQEYTLTSVRRYASAFLLYFFALQVLETERDIKVLLIVMIASCAASALVGMIEYYGGVTLIGIRTWGEGERLAGASTENPNTFATNALVALIASLYFFFIVQRPLFKA